MKDFDWIVGFISLYKLFHLRISIFEIVQKPTVDAMSNRRTTFEKMAAEASKAKEEAEAKSKELDAKIAGLSAEIEGVKERLYLVKKKRSR